MENNRVGKSYEYRALCQSCGFKFWNYELRQRWDGLWVCKADFEYRHPGDFYRTRNDTHKLPFILSDTPPDPTLTFTPAWSGTAQQLDGETAVEGPGYYYEDTLQGKTFIKFNFYFTKPTMGDVSISIPVANPVSTTTSVASTWTLPTLPSKAGSATAITSEGQLAGTGTIDAGNLTVTMTSWADLRGNLTISAVYGT